MPHSPDLVLIFRYAAEALVPSAEYKSIVHNLAAMGDNCIISATKDGVKFSTAGEIGKAAVTLR